MAGRTSRPTASNDLVRLAVPVAGVVRLRPVCRGQRRLCSPEREDFGERWLRRRRIWFCFVCHCRVLLRLGTK